MQVFAGDLCDNTLTMKNGSYLALTFLLLGVGALQPAHAASGAANVQTDAAIAGGFAGTINLAGATLMIDGALPPPDATALDTTDMTVWFDPDAEGMLAEQDTAASAKPKSPASRALWLYDRRFGATPTDGAFALTAAQVDRAPWKDFSAHGFGPARAWLDYSNVESSRWENVTTPADGNTLRFRAAVCRANRQNCQGADAHRSDQKDDIILS